MISCPMVISCAIGRCCFRLRSVLRLYFAGRFAALSTIGEGKGEVSHFLFIMTGNDDVSAESSCGEDFGSYKL